jgi:DNA mismatch repair ATPase MutS
MAGKTTYLKQVAINVVLAHLGCYVAADFASFRLVDRIFSRLGTGDEAAANSSTFLAECREIAHMLSSATRHSLCIIDELVRGVARCGFTHACLMRSGSRAFPAAHPPRGPVPQRAGR